MIEKLEESEGAASSSDLSRTQHLIAGGVAGAAATLVSLSVMLAVYYLAGKSGRHEWRRHAGYLPNGNNPYPHVYGRPGWHC